MASNESAVSVAAVSVTVVTVTYGERWHHLGRVLAALAPALAPAVAHIIVVDNGSAPETGAGLAEAARRDARLEVIRHGVNGGSAAGYGAGISRAVAIGDDYVWLLDDDNLPEDDALRLLLAAAAANEPGAALQAFRPSYPLPRGSGGTDGATVRSGGRRPWHRKRPGTTGPQRSHPLLRWGTFGGFFARSEEFAAVGLPRTDFVVYGDDTEYTYRFRERGVPIRLVPESVVTDLEEAWWARALRRSSFGGSAVPGLRGAEARRRMYYAVRNSLFFSYQRLRRRSPVVPVTAGAKIGALGLICLTAALRHRSVEPLRNLMVYVAASRDGLAGRLGRGVSMNRAIRSEAAGIRESSQAGSGVVVNGRFLTVPVTGVQRYGREVLTRLSRSLPGIDVVLPPDRRVPGRRVEDGLMAPPVRGLTGHWWEQRALPGVLDDAELLVSLANWGPVRHHNQIVTIFDTAPLHVPGEYSRRYRWLTRFLQPRLARGARRVVTISGGSRADLVADFGLDGDRIAVVPPGVGHPFSPLGPRPGGDEPYCLFVGAHDPRKNLAFLLGWWPEVRARHGLRLVVVGRERSHAHRDGREQLPHGVEVVLSPDDDDLAGLYRGAECLLSPSRYEGYGLPLLEAMASGTPFIASDAGASRDLAPLPDIQVVPLEAELWIRAIGRVIAEPDLPAASLATAARHTWDETSRRWQEIITQTLEERP